MALLLIIASSLLYFDHIYIMFCSYQIVPSMKSVSLLVRQLVDKESRYNPSS